MTAIITAIRARFSSSTEGETDAEGVPGLNTFYGVFLPSLLSIFGVIMYLRLGTVVGYAGIVGAVAIVILSSMITFITGLSISATATNSQVGGGGAYFMISRAFGIEIGSAIGLALFLAQVIGLSFYIEGFSESVTFLFPFIDSILLEEGTLIALTILAMVSANAALRTQLLILFLIVASLLSVFAGTPDLAANVEPTFTEMDLTFWGAFALFFPAVTGIEAGFSMSGDLKNPRKSLPVGTISAVVTGVVVYLLLCWFLWANVSMEVLQKDSMILLHMSRFKSLVVLGIWGATLSSAIGSLLGAPRTLQALAKDGIVPRFLSTVHGKAKEPRYAIAATFLIACVCLYFGNINVIAPVLSMFFLISYAMLNLASGIESLLDNPSWRPTFSTPWYISITGAALCLFAMLMIDSGATFIALFLVGVIYYAAKRKNLSKEWEDIHQGALLFFARFAIYRLANQNTSVRAWRPNFLVFSRSPTHRPRLIEFASSVTNNKGFLTIASLLSPELSDHEKAQRMEELIQDYLAKKKIQSLVEVNIAENILEGMKKIVTSYGLGPIAPNTIVIGSSFKEEGLAMVTGLIYHSAALGKNIVIFKERDEEKPQGKTKQTIDIWWDDTHRKNNDLMMVLAHMISDAPAWKSHEVGIKCVVPNENAREQRLEYFKTFFAKSRLEVNAKVLVVPEEQTFAPETIPMFCSNSTFLFIGIAPPDTETPQEEYAQYLQKLYRSVKSIPQLAFVLNSDEIMLNKIFT